MLRQCKANANRKRLKKLASVSRRDADFSEIAENSGSLQKFINFEINVFELPDDPDNGSWICSGSVGRVGISSY